MKIVAIIIVVIIAATPGIIKRCFYSEWLQTLADKDFVCPNCGCRFNTKWYQMIFKWHTVCLTESAVLRYPSCRRRDVCHISHDKRCP